MKEKYDVVIVGGGAAGLSAGLALSRARRSVLIVDAGSPRNAPAGHLHNYLTRDGMPPAELLAAGRAEVTGYGGEILGGTVSSAAPLADGFQVTLTDTSFAPLITSAGNSDIFMVKYDPTGALLWIRGFGGLGNDTAYGVAVDGTGSIFMTGYFQSTLDFGGGPLTSAGSLDTFLAKFNPSGAHLWSKRFGSTGSDSSTAIPAVRAGYRSANPKATVPPNELPTRCTGPVTPSSSSSATRSSTKSSSA